MRGGAGLEGYAASARTQRRVRSVLRPLGARAHTDWRRFHAVVFESDDWGLCGEGKDPEAHDRLSALGYDMHSTGSRRLYGNTLESVEDLNRLFRTLSSFEDSLGRRPLFTANFITSNPSFAEIRKLGFREYRQVPVTSGFPGTWGSRFPSAEGWREAWRRGIGQKTVVPEYHGSSHFNTSSWLRGLRRRDKKLMDFFDQEMFSSSEKNPTAAEYGVVAPPDGRVRYDPIEQQASNIERGVAIFRAAFGRDPRSTIPPHDVSDSKSWVAFARAGIVHLQSDRRRVSSMLGLDRNRPSTAFEASLRVLLQLTVVNRLYRNLRLENEVQGDPLDLSRRIFRLGSPVIVGTHRQNYVGGVDPRGAEEGVRRLEAYLKGLGEDHDVAFLSSYEAFQLDSRGFSVEKFGDEIIIRNYTRGDIVAFVGGGGRLVPASSIPGSSTGARLQTAPGGVKVFVKAGRAVALDRG